ncbi:hypothetical protein StoSoilA2_21020 [Arthrobacter sp. StoSoilA2]|uniref:hypothetical protein n=1 Tax=Arthrobacter sp. StoSoilA2 TaxID=2830990 RepID=UPI001CC36A44|nr:hypothetical protein [Arthrobacter sp. StoSoilA2]BCW36046.1 hypothetical protein StoSoilA2_21020 [Arthrobacter sp. StoSoilA2]
MSNYSPGPYWQRYEDTPFYERDRRKLQGSKHAQNALVLGIVGAFFAVMIGWIPLVGLLGVGAGVGCGVPATVQGKRAELYNVSGRAGVILGWTAIIVASAWTTIYVGMMLLSAIGGSINQGGQ